MTQVIEVPGYGDVEFPDGMSDEQIAAAIKANMQPSAPTAPVAAPPPAAPAQPNTWGQAIKNVGQGAAHLATGMVGSTAGNVAGLVSLMSPVAMIARATGHEGGAFDPTKVREKVSNALTYTPDNQDTASMKIAGAIPAAMHWAGDKLATPVRGIPYLETLAENLPEVALNAAGLKAGRFAGRAPKEAPAPIPATAELKAAKDALYKAADDAGVVIAPPSLTKASAAFNAARDARGRLPPKLADAADDVQFHIDQNKPLSLKEADEIRKKIGDAKGSTDASDRRLASIVQTKFDEYLNNLSPKDALAGDAKQAVEILKDARAMNGRLKRSEMLDEMDNIGSLRGDVNYTQAGHEHALRKQYQALAERAIKGDEHLTPAQLAAVRKVAAPGPAANMLRNLGKVDPTRGPMAGGLNAVIGGSLGGAVGSLFGPVGTGAGVMAGQAGLGVAAHVANRAALRGTVGRVASAREALVGRGLPASTAKKGVFEPISKADEAPRAAAAPAERSSTQIKIELQRLLAQMQSVQGGVSDAYAQGLKRRWDQLQAELGKQLSRESSGDASARKPTK